MVYALGMDDVGVVLKHPLIPSLSRLQEPHSSVDYIRFESKRELCACFGCHSGESRNPGCWIESSMTRQEPVRITDSHGVFIVKEWVQGIRFSISDSHADKTFEKRSNGGFGQY